MEQLFAPLSKYQESLAAAREEFLALLRERITAANLAGKRITCRPIGCPPPEKPEQQEQKVMTVLEVVSVAEKGAYPDLIVLKVRRQDGTKETSLVRVGLDEIHLVVEE